MCYNAIMVSDITKIIIQYVPLRKLSSFFIQNDIPLNLIFKYNLFDLDVVDSSVNLRAKNIKKILHIFPNAILTGIIMNSSASLLACMDKINPINLHHVGIYDDRKNMFCKHMDFLNSCIHLKQIGYINPHTQWGWRIKDLRAICILK